jgi:spore germination cell wall hydrolase CwlJ-like protein
MGGEYVNQADHLTWAKTVWSEARGEPLEGQLAVAYVPWTRAQISRRTVAQECLRLSQFSCWNHSDPNKAKMLAMDETELAMCLFITTRVLNGDPDPSYGATFYHIAGLCPLWSRGQTPCATLGHHVFYRDIAPYRLQEGSDK